MKKNSTKRTYVFLFCIFLLSAFNYAHAQTDFSTVPWYEDFEEEVNRNQWAIIDANFDSSTWEFVQSPFFNHPEDAGNTTPSYRFNKENPADDWLFSPATLYESGKTYRLRWYDYAPTGEKYEITLGVSKVPASHTIKVAEINGTSTSFIARELNFTVSNTGNYHMGIHVISKKDNRTLYVDGLRLEEVNPVDMEAVLVSGTTGTSVMEETTHLVAVRNAGTDSISEFTVSIIDKDGNKLGSATHKVEPVEIEIKNPNDPDNPIKEWRLIKVAPDSILNVQVKWTPTAYAEGENYEIRGLVEAENDAVAKNNTTASFLLKVAPFAKFTINVGDLNSTTKTLAAPINFNFKSTGIQSIYFDTELRETGIIKSISYYNDFTKDVSRMDQPVKIYLGTVGSDVKQVPVTWIKEAELVFDGNVDFPTGKNKITIELDKPYLYMGGNLVVTVAKISKYGNDNNTHFIYSSGNNSPVRTRAFQDANGSVDFDFTQSTFSAPQIIPNTTFVIESYGGKLTGTVTDDSEVAIEGAVVKIDGTEWQTITDLEGKFDFPFIPVKQYQLIVSKAGYKIATKTVSVGYKTTTTEDFELEATTNVKVSGSVTGQSGAVVVLSGETTYQTITDATGDFEFPNVYGPNSYTLRVFKSGFVAHDSKTDIPDMAEYSIPAVTLANCQGSPVTNLQAAGHTPEWYNVALSWNAPAEVTVKGYNIYRDGFLLNTATYVTESGYLDLAKEVKEYTYHVTAINSNNCESAPVSVTFNMPTYPCEQAYTDFPFFEGFESEAFSDCWTQEFKEMRAPWEIVVTNESDVARPYTGKFNAKFRNVSRGAVTKLITPKINIAGMDSPILTFAYTNPFWGGATDELRIYYRNSETGPWLPLREISSSSNEWKKITLPLIYPSDDYWIAFEGTSDYSKGIYLDDIQIMDDICNPVKNVTANQISEKSVELKWDEIINDNLVSYIVMRDGNQLALDVVLPTYIDNEASVAEHTYEILALYDNECAISQKTPVVITVKEMSDPVINLKSSYINGKVRLTWAAPAASKFSSYTIKRNGEVIQSNITTASYDDADAPSGYNTYCIVANYSGGKSSSQETCIDVIVKCDAVNDLKATVAQDTKSITVSWTADVEGTNPHPLDPAKARVILKSLNIWGNGTGYQMLLDSDANTYGNIIPDLSTFHFTSFGHVSQYVYDHYFEYKIPHNADGLVYTKNIVSDGQEFVDIEPGTYDYVITRPMLEDYSMSIADGSAGRGEKVQFEAGKVYTFEIVKMGDNVSNTYVRISDKEEIATYEVYKNDKLVTTTRAVSYRDGGTIQGEEYSYSIIPRYDSGCKGPRKNVTVKVDCAEPYNLTVDLTQGEEYCSALLEWDFEEYVGKKRSTSDDDGLIYDNGEFITHRGIGFEGADVSALYDGSVRVGPVSVANPVYAVGYYVFDDFTLDKKMLISEMEFFATIHIEDSWSEEIKAALNDKPIDQISVVIVDKDPTSSDAQIVFGEFYYQSGKNLFSSTEFINAYRTTDGSVYPGGYLENNRKIWSVKAAIDKELPPGKYWVGVGLRVKDEIAVTPMLVPLAGPAGENTGDALILSVSSGTFNPVYDDGSNKYNGIPFKIYGGEVPPAFNIYRDDKLIAEDVEGKTYVDSKVPGGSHTWKVAFQCEGGESDFATATAEACNGSGTGIGENKLLNIALYPNPANNYVIIEGTDIESAEVFDSTGQLIEKIKLQHKLTNAVNTESYAPGVYLIKVSDKAGNEIVKNIVISR